MTAAPGHADRGHYEWSASSSARLWACSGCIALTRRLTYADNESEAAAWGTACHEVSEMCLRSGKDAIEFLGRVIKTKRHEIEVDEEVAETAQVFIDYVRTTNERRTEEGQRHVWIEENFRLDAINPIFESGGTADALIYCDENRELEVVDLKGGRGIVVEATNNKQARTYGLGAVLAHPELDIETVKVTIVQPRAPHKDGRIRSETMHLADLMDWANELLEAQRRAHNAIVDFGPGEPDEEDFKVWAGVYLKAGDHCTFCPMSGSCIAQAEKAEREAKLWFVDQTLPAPVVERMTVEHLRPEEIGRILDHADMIQDWLNSVRVHAHRLAERGVEIPAYVLVEKVGREKWLDDTQDLVLAAADLAGLETEAYQNAPKLKTPKQVRKALGKANEKLVDGLSTTPTAGTQLVRSTKTVREAVAPAAHRFFEAIGDDSYERTAEPKVNAAANKFFSKID
jgi:hypothetical protein